MKLPLRDERKRRPTLFSPCGRRAGSHDLHGDGRLASGLALPPLARGNSKRLEASRETRDAYSRSPAASRAGAFWVYMSGRTIFPSRIVWTNQKSPSTGALLSLPLARWWTRTTTWDLFASRNSSGVAVNSSKPSIQSANACRIPPVRDRCDRPDPPCRSPDRGRRPEASPPGHRAHTPDRRDGRSPRSPATPPAQYRRCGPRPPAPPLPGVGRFL